MNLLDMPANAYPPECGVTLMSCKVLGAPPKRKMSKINKLIRNEKSVEKIYEPELKQNSLHLSV